MPRSSLMSRGSEMPQRPARRGPHPLRTSSSDSDTLHHRSITDRSSKLSDRRASRGSGPDLLSQKKLGTRIENLESQLGQAQEELKILKDQLVSAEAAKNEAQLELEKKSNIPTLPNPEEVQDTHPPMITDGNVANEVSEDKHEETDGFEVNIEKETDDSDVIIEECVIQVAAEPVANSDPEKPLVTELALKDDEIDMLKAKLNQKENELQVFCTENQNLKNLLNEATLSLSSAKTKEEEMSLKLKKVVEDQENAAELKEQLEAAEAEIKKMRVQTEQWRKAADAAAAVLAGAAEINGVDRHFGSSVFETPACGYNIDDLDDAFGIGKRKGSSIRKFGDLWKKKGQK
ncbi:interactor of constitutive active ROPs 4-like isoform X2 [Mercurialis annua]|uniref:interactor of constitutive active ROPs 4-like isoform X2 n=1 Tax=Mercurialis annua TaxID=3986 RepID=UPI0021607B05|nr:interactor of constitutive active ROPs 4-like isoform X2 [Mercurialis annua]